MSLIFKNIKLAKAYETLSLLIFNLIYSRISKPSIENYYIHKRIISFSKTHYKYYVPYPNFKKLQTHNCKLNDMFS
jgi:hypothetical protein